MVLYKVDTGSIFFQYMFPACFLLKAAVAVDLSDYQHSGMLLFRKQYVMTTRSLSASPLFHESSDSSSVVFGLLEFQLYCRFTFVLCIRISAGHPGHLFLPSFFCWLLLRLLAL